MIYEIVIFYKDKDEKNREKVNQTIKEEIIKGEGEILLEDDWGLRKVAHITRGRPAQGRYYYMMYRNNGAINSEISRRLRISEEVENFLVVQLGRDDKKAHFLKTYANPFVDKTSDEDEDEKGGQKKLRSRKRSCFFTANKIVPDWKDLRNLTWLINEFGKISPSRVSGVCAKYQRMATTAIKRARCMGLISSCSGHSAY